MKINIFLIVSFATSKAKKNLLDLNAQLMIYDDNNINNK
jgi:hypothetical protein